MKNKEKVNLSLNDVDVDELIFADEEVYVSEK